MDWSRLRFWERPSPQPVPVTPPVGTATRADGWENQLTGLGAVGRDKSLSAVFVGQELTPDEAEQLWQYDDLAAKVVEKIPAEAFREGFELVLPDDKQLAEDVCDYAEELGAEEKFQHAMCVERALGGAAIFPVINDGSNDLALPLNEERISEIRQLILFDPRELTAQKYYDDFSSSKFGYPEFYWLQPDVPGSAMSQVLIHESRLIVFPGIHVTRRADSRRLYRGWGLSPLTRCHRILRQFNVSWDAAGALLQDFSQAVIKVDGLAEMLAAKGEDAIRKRLMSLELQRSIIRAMLLDSKESFERTPTPMTGLPELLDRFATRFAAAADVPVSILFGDQPSGLNATGEADRKGFRDTVRAMQRKHLQSRLDRFFRLILLSKAGPTGGREPKNWTVTFRPLEQMSEIETADLRNKQADTDSKYVTACVLSPEEVAISRFGGDKYSLETIIDVRGRGEPKAPDNTPPEPMPAPSTPQDPAPGGAPAPGKLTKRVDNETLDDIDFLGLYGDLRLDETAHLPAGTPQGGQFTSGHGAAQGVSGKKLKLTQIGEKGWTGAGKDGGHAIQEIADGKWKTVSEGHSEVSAHGQVLHAAAKLNKEYRVIEHGAGASGFATLHVGAGGAVVKGEHSELAATYAKRLTTNYKSVQWHKENDSKIKAAKATAAKPDEAPPPGGWAAHHTVIAETAKVPAHTVLTVKEPGKGWAETPVVSEGEKQTKTTIATKESVVAASVFHAEISQLQHEADLPHLAKWTPQKIAAKEAAKATLSFYKNPTTKEELKAAADALDAVANKAASAGSVWGKPYSELAAKMREKAEPKSAAPTPVVPTQSSRPIHAIQGSEMSIHEFYSHRDAYTTKLPGHEHDAVKYYSDAGYQPINGGLREPPPSDHAEKAIKAMDAAIARAPAPRDLILHRGLSNAGFKALAGTLEIKPGDQFVERGFTSTSAGDQAAFHGQKNLIITVPKGYPAAPIPSYHPNENEMLLRRNTKFEVTKVTGSMIHVTVVHDGSELKTDGSPNQPRDKNGEWSSSGGGGGVTKQMAPVKTHSVGMTPEQRAVDRAPLPNPGRPSGPDATTRAEKPVAAAKMYEQTNRPAGGSQGGRWYKDEAGVEYFGKSYGGDMSRLGAEHAANQIYRTMGIKAPETHVATVDGKPVLMSKEIKGTDGDKVSVNKLHEAGLARGFVVDAWLGNRDVVGATYDNVKITPAGVPARIDNGSTFHHRAMGGTKEFGPHVGELDSMRNLQYPAGKVFGKISDGDLHEQMRDFTAKYAEKRAEIHDILEKSGMPAHEVAQIKTILDARATHIVKRAATG